MPHFFVPSYSKWPKWPLLLGYILESPISTSHLRPYSHSTTPALRVAGNLVGCHLWRLKRLKHVIWSCRLQSSQKHGWILEVMSYPQLSTAVSAKEKLQSSNFVPLHWAIAGLPAAGVLEPLLLIAQVHPQRAVAHVGPDPGTRSLGVSKLAHEELTIWLTGWWTAWWRLMIAWFH